MTFSKQPRFLAGAVCPRCAAQDKLQVYNQDGRDMRECVACGFKEQMNFQPAVRELGTRVNQTEASIEAETQVLTFSPADQKKD
ncbi:YheV family putative metal-binding protein [Exilibacterium tricleocarpae]|uniref:YheV family putative metal-binding protein n=1 Tax=Exilibacterium tricleocarpae TaxID=2591008 RepID=A0A545T0F8_9GAMM|nr:YheV family putative zinc ribbon protein [Exilibacterium tricleocarpae]TQV70707.1 YheV family putative metal-binding protein [Exilibacterium tricleocarpae]